MSKTLNGPIVIVKTGASITTAGTSSSIAIPTCQSGDIPRYIRVAATSPAFVKIGGASVTATGNDILVQPGDSVILGVAQLTTIAAIQVLAAGIVQVSPLENM